MLFFDDEGMLADFKIEDVDDETITSSLVVKALEEAGTTDTIGCREILVYGDKVSAFYFARECSGKYDENENWCLFSIKELIEIMTEFVTYYGKSDRLGSDREQVHRYKLSVSIMYNKETDGYNPLNDTI